jgi:hypothetical protein
MLLRHRLLNSENHVGEDVGDINPLVRADFEDAMVQAVEDCLIDRKLSPIREFAQKWRLEFPSGFYEAIQVQDYWAWMFVYYTGCELRRLAPRWEHCANKLKDEFGFDPSQIPQGQEFLTY